MKKLVISASVSFPEKVKYWLDFWTKTDGIEVIDYPLPIAKENFLQEYPEVFKAFFENLGKTDVLFVMNEDKKNIGGYIGAQTFAEICFCVAQNSINNRDIEIILFQMPSREVRSYDEISLWLELGWVKLFRP